MNAPKAPDAKKVEEQKKEGREQDGMTAEKVIAEMAGLGLFAHLVEAGEINPNANVDVTNDSLAVRPKDQINPNKSYKPR